MIGRLLARFRGRDERKMSTLDLFREIYGGRPSGAGVSVSWSRAIEVATVLACVRVIANGVAQVPWRVYRDDGRGKVLQPDHPLHQLIYRRPNPWQTSFAFRETLMFHVLLTGNAYVVKGMVGANRELRRLDPIDPHLVEVRRDDDRLVYRIRTDAEAPAVEFAEDEVWHLRGSSWNAWAGLDATRLAREAIGLSIATEQAHADFHRNGAKTSGLLSVDSTLSADRFAFLEAWLDRHATGGDRAQKPLVLDQGAKFTPFTMTGVDAQHLETRKHQIEEICRAFGVMPIMVGHPDKTATYASAEQMFLAHVVHTISPWYERLEQSADVDLLSDADRRAGIYTKFTPNALMRGAAADRAEFYTKALGSGGHGTAWMTPNEVRRLEELDPIEGADTLPAPPEPASGQSAEAT